MRNLLLIRDTFNEKSTLGKLYLNGEFVGHTAELPFKDNQRSISCIPQGVYTCSIRQGEQSKSYNYEHLILFCSTLVTTHKKTVKVAYY